MTSNKHYLVTQNERYGAHALQLARAFRVEVRWLPKAVAPENAGMGRKPDGSPFVLVPRVIDETTYAVFMHEMGHALHPAGELTGLCSKAYRDSIKTGQKRFSDLRDVKLCLESERNAWAWAKQYAIEWTPAMDAVRLYAIKSYQSTASYFGLKETLE